MKNPTTDKKDSIRVNRGGYWDTYPKYIRIIWDSNYLPPQFARRLLGFRIVRSKQ